MPVRGCHRTRHPSVEPPPQPWQYLLTIEPQKPLLVRTGRHEQSVEACHKLLALTPTRAEPWVILAHCYAKLGETARAREARRMAEALKTPRSEEFRTSFLRSVP